jgi:hypothetical protein
VPLLLAAGGDENLPLVDAAARASLEKLLGRPA